MINRLISNRVINLITHPLLLAFLATVLTIVLSPREFDKYQLELLKSGLEGGVYRNSVYIDLDSDGTKEKIHMRNLDTNANLVAFSQQNRILGTWILPGYWYRVPGYYLGNTDADETIELIAISIDSGDSVWVTQLDLDEDNRSKSNRFVCTLTRQNNSLDHTIRTAGFYDITGDNHPEFIFSISSGFSLHPRACFAWDLTNDTILRTPLAGINYHKLMAVYSSKYGNRIFPSVVATQNYKQAIPYSDTASYAFVLTKDLKYQFVPVYAGGSQSLTTTVPFLWQGKEEILAVTNHRRRETGMVTLRVLDQSGNIIALKDSVDLFYSVIPILLKDQVCLIEHLDRGFALYSIGPELQMEELFRSTEYFSFFKTENLDTDTNSELLFFDQYENRLGILDDDLETFTKISLTNNISRIFSVSILSRDPNQTTFFVQSQGSHYTLNYSHNSFYPFRWSFYLGIYLLYTLLLFGMQKLFLFRNRQKMEMEEEIEKLQLQSVMNQLNPHFTFNAINSMGYGMMKGDSKAYAYFASLADLIRKSMKNAFEPYKTLGEEVDFVKQYLKIESYRFGGKLLWEVELNPGVDKSIIIPKMLIHLFVENAIKHGIFHQPNGGRIDVKIDKSGDGILIRVTDNGVGMQKSYQIEQKQGDGLKILNNYLTIFNKKQKHTVRYEIQDRCQLDANLTGTCVLINIDIQRAK